MLNFIKKSHFNQLNLLSEQLLQTRNHLNHEISNDIRENEELTPSIEYSLTPRSMDSPPLKSPFIKTKHLEYDPYKVPACLILAENHGKAKKVGRIDDNLKEYDNLCPCCSLPIEKQMIPLGCELSELAFLGCAYPFYFYLMKRIMVVITVIILVLGTLKLLLINYNCNESCVTFFGFGILNLNDYREQVFGHSGIDTLFSIFLIIYIFALKSKCFEAIKLYNDTAMNPRLYTIMVQNLPRSTNKSEIYNYFKELTQKEIIKVNMAFDISNFKDLFKRKLKIASQLKELYNSIQDQEVNTNDPYVIKTIENLEKEDEELENNLAIYEIMCEESNPDKFTGTAFITFKSQTTVRILVEEWGLSFLRSLEYILFGKWTSPYLKFGKNTIIVHEAPDPTDLIWENLGFSLFRDIFNYTFLYVLSGLILILSFYIQFQVVVISTQMKEEIEDELEKKNQRNFIVKSAALGVSSITILINFLLRLTVYFFAYMEKSYSNSKFNQSYINIYILLSFFNSALMPYLVNSFFYSNKSSEQLIWDIHFILLCNAFSTPLSKIFDVFLWFRKIMRIYIRFKGKKCLIPQYNVNYWFENTSMDVAENYAYITRTFLLAVWYSSVAPLGLIYCLIGLSFNYILDKYLLLKVHAIPLHQTEEIIYKFINNFEIIPYLFLYGAIEYHSRIVMSENLIEWIWSFLFYGISSASLTLCLVIYIIFFKHKMLTKNLSPLSYNEVRHLFVSEYDRANPITQNKANKEFILTIKNNIKLSPLQKKKIMRRAAVLQEPLIVNELIGKKRSYWPPSQFSRKNSNGDNIEMENLTKNKHKRKNTVH